MSETTKRIRDIINEHTKIKQIGSYNFQIACGDLERAITTHLHQEVIRGKINLLEKIHLNLVDALKSKFKTKCISNLIGVYEVAIADLQQQITLNAKESNERIY